MLFYHLSCQLVGSSVVVPKAIHEGNGTAQLFVTNKASQEQRLAIISIVSCHVREKVHLHCLLGDSNVSWNHSLLTLILI